MMCKKEIEKWPDWQAKQTNIKKGIWIPKFGTKEAACFPINQKMIFLRYSVCVCVGEK